MTALAAPAQATDPCPSDLFEAAQTYFNPDPGYHESLQQPLEAIYYVNQPLRESFKVMGGPPAPMTRIAAGINVAMYDMLNSIYWSRAKAGSTGTPTTEVCGWEPYLTLARVYPETDADLAIGWAAHQAAGVLMTDPALSDFWERIYDRWDEIPTHFGESFALGALAADAVAFPRLGDGSDNTTAYTSASIEVKEVGAVDAPPTSRSDDQEEQAWFWANDLDGTYKPPGQLLEHTELVAKTQPSAVLSGDPEDLATQWSQQPLRVARLFAEVSLAMADAAIAAWDQKYLTAIDLWRPVTAIQQADTDGNASTLDDDDWEPLSADRFDEQFSPCFPA